MGTIFRQHGFAPFSHPFRFFLALFPLITVRFSECTSDCVVTLKKPAVVHHIPRLYLLSSISVSVCSNIIIISPFSCHSPLYLLVHIAALPSPSQESSGRRGAAKCTITIAHLGKTGGSRERKGCLKRSTEKFEIKDEETKRNRHHCRQNGEEKKSGAAKRGKK